MVAKPSFSVPMSCHAWHRSPVRVCLLLWSLLWLCCLPLPVRAEAIRLDQTRNAPLGRHAMLLQEQGAPLSLEQVRQMAAAGQFRPAGRAVPAFGIGARPVWLHFTLDNPGTSVLPRQILTGTSWTDRLDLYLLRDGLVPEHRAAGDSDTRLQAPLPGVGYVFEHDFAPGLTEIYLRVETPDPMLVPFRLLSPGQAAHYERTQHYSYGLVYGFLFALLAYNAMLFIGMRQRSHLDYSVYLGCFIVLNLAYTGHGYAWLWPDSPGVQHYVILVMMVVFACAGFRFASGFLDLPRQEPRLARFLRGVSLAAIGVVVLGIALGQQSRVALFAFSFTLLFAAGMVTLGWNAIRHKNAAGYYFLAAACCAMAGLSITTLTVWGIIPFNAMTYRAAEFGVLAEAVLLALAVAYRVRQLEGARQQAEQLARTDTLTGLLNRRAFMEIAQGLWNTAQRNERPLALIMLDLDYFKSINDRYGHAVGDHALCEIALQLEQVCRQGDLAVRWGGEEFMLLLPETSLDQARQLAERLCRQLSSEPVRAGVVSLAVQASIGVVDRTSADSLEQLMQEADRRLYRAKQGGRNQVCSSSPVLPPV